MRIPEDLQAHAAKLLRNHFAEALSSPDSLRLDWPLHPPTAATAKRDLPMTQEFIRAALAAPGRGYLRVPQLVAYWAGHQFRACTRGN